MKQQINSQQPYIPPGPEVSLPTVLTPLAKGHKECAWCWYKQNPNQPYPEKWSSTICPECEKALLDRFSQARAERAKAEAKAEDAPVSSFDLGSQIEGHPELSLVAIVDEQGHVMPVVCDENEEEGKA